MFGFGRKKFLGIDIGNSSLKVVELEVRDGKPYLSNYGWMDIPQISNGDNEEEIEVFEKTITGCLKKIIKEAKIKKSRAFVSIPAFSGLMTLIDFPDLPDEEMEQAVKFEAQKYIPTSLDDVVISWEVVEKTVSPKKNGQVSEQGPSEGGERKKRILLVAASKKKVAAYEYLVKKAGIKLKGVEMENIAIVEALIGNDKGNFVVVDIGSRACNIIYVEKGIIKVNRNVDVGGNDITETISKSLNINKERAEDMKTSGENFFGHQSNLNFSSLDVISGEIARIREILVRDKGSASIEALILSGGTSKMGGLVDFMQQKTGIKTIIGNPFSRIEYNKKLEKIIAKQGGKFTVSIGLALKGVKEEMQK